MIKDLLLSDQLNNLEKTYTNALLSGKRLIAADLIFKALDENHSVSDIYQHVFRESQVELGRLWETNQISVAQEHYCTAITQSLMSQLYPKFAVRTGKGKKIVVACVGGELHELGARMATDFFEMDGWQTYFIGANTPKESLILTIREQKPDLLGLSVTMSHNLPQSIEVINTIRADSELKNLAIMVGGRAFNVMPNVWEKVGADLFSDDIIIAIKLANQLTAQIDEVTR
jgi:methanogenic corrinoid protein MtbC1